MDSSDDEHVKPVPSPKRASKGKQPPKKKRRKSNAVEDSDDEQAVQMNGVEEEEQPAQEEEEEDDNDDEEEEVERCFERDEKDGYVPGSIVRVKLINFVTYDKVEFTPGPSLNMVLGPNGTGKSTLACAIALGLGFPPKVLGRADKLALFVKTGYDECTIEIELKGLKGEENQIIRRLLNKENDQTKFFLNNQRATAGEVKAIMEKLHVQVGNLCTFLPQERVASFAQLSPSELLKETQKAAGNPNLTKWHEILIAERKTERSLKEDLGAEMEKLQKMDKRQQESKKEVESFEQRLELERQQSILNIRIPYAEYIVAQQTWQQSKTKRIQLNEEVKEMELENRPFTESKTSLEASVKWHQDAKKAKQSKITKLGKEIADKAKAVEKCEKDGAKIRETLQNIKHDEKDRIKRIKDLEKDVAKIRLVVDNPPPPLDEQDIANRIEEQNRLRRELAPAHQEASNEANEHQRAISGLFKDEERVSRQIATLKNVESQRDEACSKNDLHTWKALKWFRAHKHEFKGVACEPLMVCLNVKDKKYLQLAEAPLSFAMLKTFVFEKQEDYDYMMSEVNDKIMAGENAKIKCNAAHLGGPIREFKDVRRKFDDQKLQEWGFDCLAIDLLEGPDLVKTWLCTDQNFAGIPISLTNRPINAKAVESSRMVPRYYSPDGSHTIKWSNYGARSAQSEQRQLGVARNLSQGVDAARLAPLEEELAQCRSAKQDHQRKKDAAQTRANELKAQLEEVETTKNELADQRQRAREPLRKYQQAEVNLKSKLTELEKQKNRPNAAAKRDRARAEMVAQTAKRVQCAMEYKQLLFDASVIHFSSTTIQLEGLQAENDLRAMDNSAEEKDRELNEKKAELQEVAAQTAVAHQKAKKVMEHANALNKAADKDIQDEVEELGNSTSLEDLNKEWDDVIAQLDLIQPVSKKVLEAYENRKKGIEELREKCENMTAKLAKSTATLTKVQAKWLPKLQHLIQAISTKFGAAFDLLGLLGEVQIYQDEDYDKWGVHIFCSFRDGEEMQLLTSHRQSGGERALTTVMYLMALAGLAKAPFGLVDEINQGMDQRVERQVHNALVGVTCKADVGQYFLITPKLLPNLDYHPMMKILVINNGDWIPEKLSLAQIVKTMNKLNKNRPALGRTVAAH